MARARVDSSIQRHTVPFPAPTGGGGQPAEFEFPLGVYPVEPMTPIEGYTLAFEAADDDPPDTPRGGPGSGRNRPAPADSEPSEEDSAWREDNDEEDDDPFGPGEDPEPWPDRYVFDINIRASRLEALTRQLFALLPGRVFPILDVMGNDGYREIDPYIAYDLVGVERYLDAVRRFRAWFFEDGMVGFGAMSEDPFFYIFVDEHKIVTLRVPAHQKEHVEKILRAFDLNQVDKIAGADAAVHEHRGVLDAPGNRPDLLTHDELVEQLRDDWGLSLNIDPFNNQDEGGTDLGITPWRTVVRVFDEGGEVRYAEVFLTADSLQRASELAVSAAEGLLDDEAEREAFPNKPGSGNKPTDTLSTKTPSLGTSGGEPVGPDLTLDPPADPGADLPTPTDEPSPVIEEWEKSIGETGEIPDIPLDDLDMDMEEFDVLVADRIRPEEVDRFPALAGQNRANMKNRKVISSRWLE